MRTQFHLRSFGAIDRIRSSEAAMTPTQQRMRNAGSPTWPANGISASDFVPDVSRVRPRLHVRQVPFEGLRDRFVVALILVGVGLGERRYRLVEDRLTAKITRD